MPLLNGATEILLLSLFYFSAQCISDTEGKETRQWLRKLLLFLGRLPKVDLIILEGEKCPSVRPSIRPQKVSSISMKFGM